MFSFVLQPLRLTFARHLPLHRGGFMAKIYAFPRRHNSPLNPNLSFDHFHYITPRGHCQTPCACFSAGVNQRYYTCSKNKKSTSLVGSLSIGLPERIRTAGLQSRSLTRYPAVPRVDDLCIVSQKSHLVK